MWNNKNSLFKISMLIPEYLLLLNAVYHSGVGTWGEGNFRKAYFRRGDLISLSLSSGIKS